MLNARLSTLCPVIALVLAAAASAAPEPLLAAAKPYKISGANRDERGKWQPTEVLEQTRSGVVFQMQFLEPDAARRVLSSMLGRDVDLLPGRLGERRRGYLVFVLQIANASPADVTFNPTQARLSTEKGDMEFALDYSALYDASRLLGPDGPGLEQMATAIFDRSLTIKPEGSVRKLLAFPAPREDKYKTIEVRLAEVNVGAAAVDVVFFFRKFFQE